MSALLLHGVVQSSARLPVDDLFGLGRLLTVEADDMAFAASPVPGDVDITEVFADPQRAAIAALGHHEILCEIAAVTDVVPLRLGTAVSGSDSARRRLAEIGATIRPKLMRIEGLVEYRAVARGEVEADGGAPSGAGYLRKRLAERTNDENLISRLDLALMRLSAATGSSGGLLGIRGLRTERPLERSREATVLVERGARIGFGQAAKGIIAEEALQAITLTLDGPWPAYTLAGEDLH